MISRVDLVVGVVGVFLLVALAAVEACAARLALSGADACADADAIAEQASDLLGRPLASVPGVDFEVELRRAESGRWRLRLDTIEGDADRKNGPSRAQARRSRELVATSCAELADAAAVGIAMSVRALATGEPSARQGRASEEQRLSGPPGPPPSVAAGPAPVPDPASSAPALLAGRVAVAGDAGALPGATVGIELGARLRLPRIHFGVSGTALAPRVAHVAGDRGGEVRLLYGTAESCVPVGLGRATVLGCAGFELGRLSAEGTGIARPRLGATWWQTVRAELGVSLALGPRLALVLRAGAGLPLSRPQFVIDGMTPVHRPSSLVARASTGVELEF